MTNSYDLSRFHKYNGNFYADATGVSFHIDDVGDHDYDADGGHAAYRDGVSG